MSTHTPGPWLREPYGAKRSLLYQQGATGMPPDFVAVVEGDHQLEDARLIAAAPELLRALEVALDTIRTISRRPDPDMEQEAVDMARAAIKKARGE